MMTKRYTTKELESSTWTDFIDLFSRGNGWDFCACMYFLRGGHLPAKQFSSRQAKTGRNRDDHRKLVGAGRADGVLVYADGRPIGWCQYGRAAEFPVGATRPLGPTSADWRITCFVTEKAHRGAGVARSALRGVLEAVRRRGGGIVEAYPVAALDRRDPATAAKLNAVRAWSRERSQIIREGRWSAPARWDAHMAARPSFKVNVEGVGLVTAWDRPDQQLINAGTVSMFEREGFRGVRLGNVSGETRVVMQKRLAQRVSARRR